MEQGQLAEMVADVIDRLALSPDEIPHDISNPTPISLNDGRIREVKKEIDVHVGDVGELMSEAPSSWMFDIGSNNPLKMERDELDLQCQLTGMLS